MWPWFGLAVLVGVGVYGWALVAANRLRDDDDE